MNVNEMMTTPVLTCSPTTSLEEVARRMWEGDCGAVPVVSEDNEPLGMVTDRDITMCAMLNHQPLWEISAATVIAGRQPLCCDQQDDVDTCIDKMQQHGVRRMMITDAKGRLSGIVSLGDAIAFTQTSRMKDRKHPIRVEPVLAMLRSVSAHHQSGAHLPARA